MMPPPVPPPHERLSLDEALRRYWKNLIGLAVLPALAALGHGAFRIPPLVFLPAFFAACLHAGLPYFRHRAPYAFWMVACGVWVAAGVFGLILLALISHLKG